MATFRHIKFGDGLTVIDEGANVITVNGTGGPTGPTGPQGVPGPPGLIGTYLTRPAANTVAAGTFYYASDTLGGWRSDGTSWTLISQGAPLIAPANMDAPPFTTPYDGQRMRLLVDATNGIIWEFAYRAAASSSFKWECVGGLPLGGNVQPNETTSSTTPADLATPGPTVTIPRAGNYRLVSETIINSTGTATIGNTQMFRNGTTAITSPSSTSNAYVPAVLNASAFARRTLDSSVNFVAGDTAMMKYFVPASLPASVGFQFRRLEITPSRIS